MSNKTGLVSLNAVFLNGVVLKAAFPVSIVVAFVFGLFDTGQCNADIILEYVSASSTENPSITPSVESAAIAAKDLEAGTGINSAAGGSWNWRSWDSSNQNYADAVADDEIWSWGFDVKQSATVELTDLAIKLDRSGTGPDDFEIRLSVNNGPADTILSYDFDDADSAVEFDEVDLSWIAPLSQGDSVRFTLAAYNAEGGSGTFDLENFSAGYGLRINGSITAVPEPPWTAFIALILVITPYMVVSRQ